MRRGRSRNDGRVGITSPSGFRPLPTPFLMMTSRVFSVATVFLAILLVPGSMAFAQGHATSTAVDTTARHENFTRVLNRFVDEEGYVDYQALKQEAGDVLVPYLKQLERADPSAWSRDERLAFWINAYNAYALKLIVDNYPVKSIWATTEGPAKPDKENSPFALKIAPVADTARTLDEIEHEIIRERFDEPRIHFAIVCAAESCPPLRREAYTGARLDEQLDEQGRRFLRDDDKNRIPAGSDMIALNRILNWFGEDFGPSTDALQKYIARYFEGTVRDRLRDADYQVEFLEYDWTLNDQARFESANQASN